jgi:hypothetical protein
MYGDDCHNISALNRLKGLIGNNNIGIESNALRRLINYCPKTIVLEEHNFSAVIAYTPNKGPY